MAGYGGGSSDSGLTQAENDAIDALVAGGAGGGTGAPNYANRTVLWAGSAKTTHNEPLGTAAEGDVIFITLQNGNVYWGVVMNGILRPVMQHNTNLAHAHGVSIWDFATSEFSLKKLNYDGSTQTNAPYVELAILKA